MEGRVKRWILGYFPTVSVNKSYLNFIGLSRDSEIFISRLRNPDGATINLACRDMRQFEFLALSRMSLKLHTYEGLKPSRDNRGEILCA